MNAERAAADEGSGRHPSLDDRFDPAVRIVDYDPAWPALAAAELRRMEDALGGVAVRLEHMGSTAVPGLASKPILDLQLSVESLQPRERYVEPLERLGYLYTATVTALDPSRSSLAGGLVYMFQVAGGAVGLGLTTTVFITASEDSLQESTAGRGLGDDEIETLQGTLAGTDSAAEILQRFSERAADRLLEIVREAFASGMQWSFRLVAALALCGLVVSVLFVGERRRATSGG